MDKKKGEKGRIKSKKGGMESIRKQRKGPLPKRESFVSLDGTDPVVESGEVMVEIL